MSGAKRERPGSSGNGKPKSRAKTAIVPIYARLPKGPHSIGASGVARNQRIRMHGGMIEAVTTRGYEQTSVRLVIGLAGVSRRAFYEQFSGKEDCFMATFDLIVKRAIQRLTHAYRTAEGSPERRLRTVLEALGAEIEQNPKALHLVLIDAQTAGPGGLRRLHRTTALCEELLSSAFSDRCWSVSGRSGTLPPPVVRAIVGGLRRATSTRLREGQTEDLGALTREMLKWSLLFKSPALAELRPRPCANPPFPEVASLERDACGGDSESARLLRSAIDLRVREEKLDELSSLRIADGANLPIEAFMERFSSPEACYLEALNVLGDELLQLVADPGLVSTEWPAAVCRTVAHLFEWLASSPARLRTLAVKGFEAGPLAVANLRDLAYEVATLLTEGAPRRPRTGIAVEGIAGGLWQVLNCEVTAGRGHRLPVLCEYVSYVILAPFLGPEAATRAIVRSRKIPANALPELASAAEAQLAGAAAGAHAGNGTQAADGRAPAARGKPPTNGKPATNGAPASNRPVAEGGAGANGSAPADEDYRRLAERRSAKCVKTTPTSAESTITTIKGA
jgi:AcrR family transcriptional regulator